MKKLALLLASAMIAAMACAQRIAVVSDAHVTPGNSCESQLRAVVSEINASDFDLVIVNGDLSNQGTDQELALVKSILDQVSHPLRVVPGNHENNWSQSATTTFSRLWGNDRFAIAIDSLVVVGINCGPFMKMGDGHVKQEDLHWLRHTLDSLCTPGSRVLSFNHYPIRKDDLDNYGDYARTLAPYPVIAHINGHYHEWMRYKAAGLECAMTRALHMGQENYGYAIIEITPDWIQIYDKALGQKPEPKFAFPARVEISIDEASKLGQAVNFEKPKGYKIENIWADSASIFTRLGFDKQRVYFGTSLGDVKALDKTTGQLAWTMPLGGTLYSRPVALAKGLLALPHTQGLDIVDAQTGGTKHKTRYADSWPYVADGLVAPDGRSYLQGAYKRFECRDAVSGKLRWVVDSLGNYCQAAPAVEGNDVVFGAWDGYLRCVDLASGQLRWQWSNGKSNNMLGPGNVVPVIAGTNVIIVAPDRYMTAIDRNTGQTIWRDNSYRYRESLGHNVDGSVAYAKTMDGELVAVDATAPRFNLLWVLDLGLGYDHAPCIVAEAAGIVYAGSRRGLVTAIDPANQEVIWQLPLGSSEINGIDIDPTDNSVWVSLIEGTIFHITKQ